MTMNPTAAEMQTASSDVPFRPEELHRTSTGAWRGWIIFAGVMLALVGCFQLIAGLVAIFEHHYYLVGSTGLTVHVSYNVWGGVHLGLALVNISAAFGLFTGKTWARIWAILVAGVSAIVNLGFTGAYPVWSVIMIALDVIVIYALAVHWEDAKLE